MKSKSSLCPRPSRLPRTILAASAASLVVAVLAVPSAQAQFISLTGPATYTQNFDLLGTATLPWVDNSTIPGWHAGINSNTTADGNAQASDGAAALNGLLNLGTTGAADRALGSKATSGGANANIAFGVLFQNNSGLTLDITNIAYVGELWRTNDTAGGLAEIWRTFTKISTTVFTDTEPGANSATANVGTFTAFPALDWSSPTNTPVASALNGNLAANRAARSADPNLLLAPGEFFMFRWVDPNLGGVDGFQGIDDLSITFITSTIPNNLTYNLLHNVGGRPDGIVQAGVGSGAYWLRSGNPAELATNDNIFFSQDGSATLSVPANVDLNNITVNAASGTYTFNGAGSMNGALIKSSGSNLVLNNSNNFSSLTLSDLGLVIAGAPQNIAGAITSVVNTPTIQTDSDVTAGFLNGTELLTKTGSAALILTGTGGNATGGLTIAAGKVSAAAPSALGGSGQAINVSGTTLEFTGTAADQIFSDATTTRTLNVGAGGATIGVTGSATASVNIQLADSIVGAGTITKTGIGVLRMGAAVAGGINQTTFTGNWIVNEGVLEYGNAATNALGTGTVTVNAGGNLNGRNTPVPNAITLDGGNLGTRSGDLTDFQGPVNVATASTVALRSYTSPANAQTISISGVLSGAADLTVNGNLTNSPTTPKALILTNPGNTYSGNFRVTAAQALASAPVVTATGSAFGTGIVHLEGGILAVRDEGTGSDGTIAYGTDIRVQTGAGVISVGHALAAGVNTGNTVVFGPLTIGAQTLNVVAADLYKVEFSSVTLSGAAGTSATIIPDSSAPTTITGAISGVAGLTKGGLGSLTLAGASTYTGVTSIEDGTLVLTGTIATTPRIDIKSAGTLDTGVASFTIGGTQTLSGTGLVTGPTIVGNGGRIEGGDAFSVGTLTIGELTFGAGAGDTATIRASTGNPAGSLIVAGFDLLTAIGGAGTVTVNIAGSQPAAFSQHVLIDYDGTIGNGIGGDGSGAFVLGSLPPRTNATLTNNLVNTSIDLVVGTTDSPIWSGKVGSEWSTANIAAPKNWVLASNPATGTDFITFDKVLFNDSATTTAVDISGADVQPQEVVFANNTKNYTLTGTNGIAGTIGVTMNGGATLTISNTNSFAGPVTLNAGTVSVATVADAGVNSPLGAGVSLDFNGGTLDFTGASGSTNRAVNVDVDGAFVKTDTALTLTGVIGGVGEVTKSGSGTLTLTGASTFSAALHINGGTVSVATLAAAGGPSPLGAGTEITFDGGTLEYTGAAVATLDRALTLDDGGGTLRNVGNIMAIGIIAGTGDLTKVGAGTVTINGVSDNTYTGVTRVTEGGLILSNPSGINSIGGDLIVETGGTVSYGTTAGQLQDHIPDTASITINGGTFGSGAGNTDDGPTQGVSDTVASVTVNSGKFLSGRQVSATPTPFVVTGDFKLLGGTGLVQRGAGLTANAVEVASPAVLNLDGGSNTANNQSRLNVGPGGLTLIGATINFNAGPSAVIAASVGSVVTLNGDVTSTGTSSIARLNPTVSSAIVDLATDERTFDVTGTLTVAPDVGTAADLALGGIIKTGPGKLVLEGAQSYASLTNDAGRTDVVKTIGTGTSTVTANAGTINLGDSVTLASLVIGDDATVTLGTPLPAAPVAADEAELLIGQDEVAGASAIDGGAALSDSPVQAVPEPGSLGLLGLGALSLLGRRRRNDRA